MSGDLTARNVIAQGIRSARAPHHRGDCLCTACEDAAADRVLAALAAAGWELHRAGEVVPTSDVLMLAQRWDHTAAGNQLRALTQQEPPMSEPSSSNPFVVAARQLTELGEAVATLMAEKLDLQVENQQLRDRLNRQDPR